MLVPFSRGGPRGASFGSIEQALCLDAFAKADDLVGTDVLVGARERFVDAHDDVRKLHLAEHTKFRFEVLRRIEADDLDIHTKAVRFECEVGENPAPPDLQNRRLAPHPPPGTNPPPSPPHPFSTMPAPLPTQ